MGKTAYHHGNLKSSLIQAGIEILANEGVGGLSLRKVARKAGVSHAAPYAHFADKEALIAAIASDGHHQINTRLEAVQGLHASDPVRLLCGSAWAYISFGLDFPAHYKITFLGALENEHSHPEFVDYSKRNFQLLKNIVEQCRAAGVVPSRDIESELQAIALWGQVHGLVSLVIQGQLPNGMQDRAHVRQMLLAALRQVLVVPIDESMID